MLYYIHVCTHYTYIIDISYTQIRMTGQTPPSYECLPKAKPPFCRSFFFDAETETDGFSTSVQAMQGRKLSCFSLLGSRYIINTLYPCLWEFSSLFFFPHWLNIILDLNSHHSQPLYMLERENLNFHFNYTNFVPSVIRNVVCRHILLEFN